MTYVVQIDMTDYAESGDTSTELVGPFRLRAKAEEFADKINARVPGTDAGAVSASVRWLRAPRLLEIVREMRAWVEGQG